MSSPSTPQVQTSTPKAVATPTPADASVQKASSHTRNRTAALAGRDIKTSPRGLGEDAETQKKQLLGQ